jgi:cell division protein FtsB
MSTARDRRRTRSHVLRFAVRALCVVVGVELILAVAGDRGLLALQAAKRDLGALGARVEAMRSENAALQRENRRLREDPSAIEELARRELGLIKPGEVVFIIRENPSQ